VVVEGKEIIEEMGKKIGLIGVAVAYKDGCDSKKAENLDGGVAKSNIIQLTDDRYRRIRLWYDGKWISNWQSCVRTQR